MIHGILFLSMILTTHAVDFSRLTNPYNPKPFKSCFEHLGCLNTDVGWYNDKKRPRNLEPLDRHTIRTEFILIKTTSNSSDLVYDIMTDNVKTIEVAGFTKGSHVMFLIHDFTSNGYTGWVKHMARVVVPTIPNVISIDWEAGAEPPYIQAIANARVVALEAIHFIKILMKDFGADPKNIHLVGHGVGAHICGYIGETLKNINRITGLDPSGVFFEGMPNDVKLDPSDATFVEVIHTDSFNSKSQGTKEAMGHIDFYVNGAGHQPGCNTTTGYPEFTKLTRNSLKEGTILPGCSHKRSFKYFIESIENSDCQFIGISCKNYEEFLKDKCMSCKDSSCSLMGLQGPKQNTTGKILFLETKADHPFCMHPYVVDVTLAQSSKKQRGELEMIFIDENNLFTNASITFKRPTEFLPGKAHSGLYYAPSPKVSVIKEAKVRWIHTPSPFCVIFCDKSIYIKEIIVHYLSMSGDSPINRLCPSPKGGKIETGSYVQFLPCDHAQNVNFVEPNVKTTKHK